MVIDLYDVAEAFGLEVSTCEQAKNSILSQTYIADEKYILRSRKLMPDTVERLGREITLIDAVRPLTELKFPKLLPSRDGNPYVIGEKFLWTAYPLIRGDVLCSWWNLELLNDEAGENLYRSLKELHEKTAGELPEIPWNSDFLNDIRRWLINAPAGLLTQEQHNRLEKALAKVGQFEKTLTEQDLCFIHGDYHPGNIIFEDNKVVGLIDTDWSRKGCYMEDLSYTLMTLMRDFRGTNFQSDGTKFDAALRWYGFGRENIEIFSEYMLLAIFYDLYLMGTLPELQDKTNLVPFQRSFLDNFIRRC